MACMVRGFTWISLLESNQILLTGERSYQWLKDATSFGLISDKSAEKLEVENLNVGHFSISWAPCYVIMVRAFTSISLLSVGFLSNPFNWRRSYQGLKDATSFGLISDRSTE